MKKSGKAKIRQRIGQKKQCHVDTARNKSPAKTGMEQAGLGKGKLFHTDSNDD